MHDEHPAIQYTTEALDNRADAFLRLWMNSFPVKSGIPQKWSPREIVLGHRLDIKLHCKVPFGADCEVHVNPNITNTMEPRTRWAICLGPTGTCREATSSCHS